MGVGKWSDGVIRRLQQKSLEVRGKLGGDINILGSDLQASQIGRAKGVAPSKTDMIMKVLKDSFGPWMDGYKGIRGGVHL